MIRDRLHPKRWQVIAEIRYRKAETDSEGGTIGTIIASIIFVLIGFIAGGLLASTWQIDSRPIRLEEPRGLTQADIIKALREDARKEEDSELHSGI